MTATGIGIGGIVALFVLVMLHIPLAFAMIVVGIVAFADAATMVLLHLHAESGPNRMHPGLVALVENRAEVHQATGMVSVQAVLSLAEALLLLRAHAYSAERPILDVARDVIARILRFAPEDDHHE